MDWGQRKEGSEKESKSRSNMAMSVGKYGHEEIHEIARVVVSCKEPSARGGKPAVIANPSTSPWHHEKDVPKLPVRIQCPGSGLGSNHGVSAELSRSSRKSSFSEQMYTGSYISPFSPRLSWGWGAPPEQPFPCQCSGVLGRESPSQAHQQGRDVVQRVGPASQPELSGQTVEREPSHKHSTFPSPPRALQTSQILISL